MKDKPILEVIQGIPIPGMYDDLKGIELWGDGEIYDRKESKKKEKKVGGNLSQKVAKVTARFTPMTEETPDFLDESGQVMMYDQFVALYGECVDSESYEIITEVYRSAVDDVEEDGFIFQMTEGATHYMFKEVWYPIILENMKKPSVRNGIHQVVSKFIDANQETLSKRYPAKNVLMTDVEIYRVCQLIGIPKDKLTSIVKEMLSNLDTKTEFKSISKSPHQIIFSAMLVAATVMKDEKLIQDCTTLVIFSIYPLMFRKYFPVTDPNEMAMEQAVLTATKKFYISKTKSVLEWIQILIDVPYKFYKDKFATGNVSDELYVNFLNRVRNTINQQMKSLYQIYKKAYDKQAISTLGSGDYVTLGSDADKIQIYTLSVTDKISNMGYRQSVCKSVAEYTKTNLETVEKYVKEYTSHYADYGLSALVQSILTIYFNIGKSNDFLSVAIRQYPKAINGKASIHKDLRDYLFEMEKKFKKFDPEYIRRYTFAVYLYFSILINIAMNNITTRLVDISLAKLKNLAKEGNDIS